MKHDKDSGHASQQLSTRKSGVARKDVEGSENGGSVKQSDTNTKYDPEAELTASSSQPPYATPTSSWKSPEDKLNIDTPSMARELPSSEGLAEEEDCISCIKDRFTVESPEKSTAAPISNPPHPPEDRSSSEEGDELEDELKMDGTLHETTKHHHRFTIQEFFTHSGN